MIDNNLDRDDCVGAAGNDAAGRDRHRLPRFQRPWRGNARRDARNDGQAARRVGSPQRESVHRRAGKRRQIDQGAGVLSNHSAERLRNRHPLAFERLHPLEHARLRLPEREQLRHLARSVPPR